MSSSVPLSHPPAFRITKRNDRALPYLDAPLLDLIFDGVYGRDCEEIADKALRDFLLLLYAMQGYNYAYRQSVR